MTKQHLLLVDGDPRSLRMMEVSLRKAGFTVSTAVNGRDALAHCQRSAPDLILSDTRMPEMDGFELCRRLKDDARLQATPFIFLTDQKSVEEKVRGLELGVEDYLTKPIYVREVVTRVKILLERRARERLDWREPRASFSGRLSELGMVDLVQTLDIGKKSGTVRLRDAAGREGTIWFRDGQVVDCGVEQRTGEAAFYRLLGWESGQFSIEFAAVDRPDRIRRGTQALLIEGMRRQEEWVRLRQRLPLPDRALQIDYRLLAERLAEIPDDVNAILRLVDGRRTLAQLVAEAEHDDLATGGILARLCEERVLVTVPPGDRRPVPEPPAMPTPPDVGAAPRAESTAGEPGVDWLAGPVAAAPAPDPEERADGGPPPAAGSVREVPPPAGEPAAPRIVRFADRRRQPPTGAPLGPGALTPPRFDPVPGPAAPTAHPTPRPTRPTPRPTPRPAALRPAPTARPPLKLAVAAFLAVAAGGAAVTVLSARSANRSEGMPPTPGERVVVQPANAEGVAGGPPVATPPSSPAPVELSASAPQMAAVAPFDPGAAGGDPGGYDEAMAEARLEHAGGRLAAAVAWYRRALSLRETSAALEGLGRVLHEDRQVEPALAALRRAIELDGGNAEAYIALGRVYLGDGRLDEAREAYRRYLALEPEGGHAGEARAALGGAR